MADLIEWIVDGLVWLWEFVIISLIFAIIILIVGYIIAKIVKWLVVKVLFRLRFDELFRETGLVETVRGIGFRGLPDILGLLIFWFVFLFFVAMALAFLEFDIIAEFVTLIIEYLPKLFGAILIALGGLWLGTWLSKRVEKPLIEADVPLTPETTSTIIKWVVIFIAIVMALGLMEIDTSLLILTFTILIGALGVALAISFGIGGRDVAANVSAYASVAKLLRVGDDVTIGEHSGVVLLVTRYNTVLKTKTDDRITIPNATIANAIVVKRPR